MGKYTNYYQIKPQSTDEIESNSVVRVRTDIISFYQHWLSSFQASFMPPLIRSAESSVEREKGGHHHAIFFFFFESAK